MTYEEIQNLMGLFQLMNYKALENTLFIRLTWKHIHRLNDEFLLKEGEKFKY